MTITVGTDTYVSLADARAYITKNGLTPLPTVDADAEALLVRATFALDRIYGNRYLGMKRYITQNLAWPRLFAAGQPHGYNEWPYIIVDSDGNPRDFSALQPETAYATSELASMLTANPKFDPYEQPKPVVNYQRDVLDGMEHQIRTTDGNSYRELPMYKITLLLRPLTSTPVGSSQLTRGG